MERNLEEGTYIQICLNELDYGAYIIIKNNILKNQR
jgi:hypothetical protein